MSDSSIKSEFQFDSYKVDKIDFSVLQNLSTLGSKSHSNCDVSYKFGFRNAIKFIQEEGNDILYVTGLQVVVDVHSKGDNVHLANGLFIITGLFTSQGTLDKEIECNLVKCQAPAILFPYARAIIAQTLSNAGFSTMVMPLVNVNAMAQNAEIEIEERILEK